MDLKTAKDVLDNLPYCITAHRALLDYTRRLHDAVLILVETDGDDATYQSAQELLSEGWKSGLIEKE